MISSSSSSISNTADSSSSSSSDIVDQYRERQIQIAREMMRILIRKESAQKMKRKNDKRHH